MSGDDWSRKTRGGIIWSTLSYGAGRGITMLSTVVLARLLVPAEFGVVAAIAAFLALIGLASDLGMNATVVYEQQRDKPERLHVAFTLNLLFAIFLTGVGVAAAPAVASLFGAASHAGLFRLGALSLIFAGFGNIHDSLLLRELDFRRRIIPELLRNVVRAGVSIGMALSGFGAASLVIGMLAGGVIWTIAQWVLTRYRPRLSLDREIVRGMIAYGSGAAVLELVAVVANRIDQLVISRVLGQTALGLYTIAFRVPEMAIDSISWNVSLVAFPALARKRVADEQGLGAATVSLMRYQTLYALPVCAGLAMLASPLVVVLFGRNWAAAGPVMSAVCVLSGLTAVLFPLGDVFKAIGRQRTLIGLTLLQLPPSVGVIVAVAPYGITPVAWARVGTMLIYAPVVGWFVMRAANIDLVSVLGAVRPGVAAGLGVALGSGLVRLLLPSLSIGPLLIGAVAGLAGGCLALRLLSPGTLAELVALVPRRRRPAATAHSQA